MQACSIQPKVWYFRTSNRVFPGSFVPDCLVKGNEDAGEKVTLNSWSFSENSLLWPLVSNQVKFLGHAYFTVQKISRSVRSAWIIRSKHLSICSNGLSHPLRRSGKKQTWSARSLEQLSISSEKSFTRLDGYSHPLEMPELSLKDSADDSFFLLSATNNLQSRPCANKSRTARQMPTDSFCFFRRLRPCELFVV